MKTQTERMWWMMSRTHGAWRSSMPMTAKTKTKMTKGRIYMVITCKREYCSVRQQRSSIPGSP